jgi:hypothetical protein
VNTIGQHVRSATHVLAKKIKATIGTIGIQMTLQDFFTKRVLVGKVKYPPYIPKIIDILHNDLVSYCQQHICHGFHNYFISIRDDLIDVHPLLNDHMIGKGWYVEPNYKHIILGLTNEIIQIEGTFRHFECSTMFYNKCSLIPNFPNFQKQASQLNSMIVPKGERKCEQGSRWDMLQRRELIKSCKGWESRCHAINDQMFLLNSKLTRVIKSRNYFSIKLQSILVKGSIPNIIELFKRASNVRAFEEHLILSNLLMDIVYIILFVHKNGGKGNGKQYHASMIKLFEVFLKIERSSMHNFMNKNLVGPALNTIRSNFCKEGFIYSIGINEFTFRYMCLILKKCKEKLGLSMPIPFECGDETKSIKLTTWNRRLDTIDGFCGFQISPQHLIHQCKFTINPSST